MSQHFLNESMSSLTKTRHRVPKLGEIQGRSSPGTLKKSLKRAPHDKLARKESVCYISPFCIRDIQQKEERPYFPSEYFPAPLFPFSKADFSPQQPLIFSQLCFFLFFTPSTPERTSFTNETKMKKYHLQRLLWFSSFPRVCE